MAGLVARLFFVIAPKVPSSPKSACFVIPDLPAGRLAGMTASERI